MKDIYAVALDVDGVLTDGTVLWSPKGDEFKSFSFRDIMGISLGQKAGLVFALISGEQSPQAVKLAEKMKIKSVYFGCKDKAAALCDFSDKIGIPLPSICFMGDDINDLPAMNLVRLSAAPADAHSSVLAKVFFVSEYPGGKGAVRELVDAVIASRLTSFGEDS